MRTAALTITVLFCLAGWGACARDGVEHPSKNDAGAPADDGGETAGEAKAEEPAKEVAPAPAKVEPKAVEAPKK